MSKAKKILGLVLSVLMVLNLFSVAVSAVDAEVAENTTQAKTYTDFATAISEAQDGDEIVLTGRVKLDSLVEVNADLILLATLLQQQHARSLMFTATLRSLTLKAMVSLKQITTQSGLMKAQP